MADPQTEFSLSETAFKGFVKECAREAWVVSAFNRAYDLQLEAPIPSLVEDRWPHDVSEDEAMQVGCFIVFVHVQIWERLQRAQARMRSISLDEK